MLANSTNTRRSVAANTLSMKPHTLQQRMTVAYRLVHLPSAPPCPALLSNWSWPERIISGCFPALHPRHHPHQRQGTRCAFLRLLFCSVLQRSGGLHPRFFFCIANRSIHFGIATLSEGVELRCPRFECGFRLGPTNQAPRPCTCYDVALAHRLAQQRLLVVTSVVAGASGIHKVALMRSTPNSLPGGCFLVTSHRFSFVGDNCAQCTH